MKKNILLLSSICLLFSLIQCKKEGFNFKTTKTVTVNNKTEETSTDIDKLAKLIDLKGYKPLKAKYHYTYINNSEGRIPGPSDSFLEAEMEFDDKTMKKIDQAIKDSTLQKFAKKEFEFPWLDKETKEELLKAQDFGGTPDFLFGTNGMLWILKNRILLKKNTF